MNKCYMCKRNITNPDDETWVTFESFEGNKTIKLCPHCADDITERIEDWHSFYYNEGKKK